MEKVWVISLGGSRIAPSPGKVDYVFIKKFEELLRKHKTNKFVVVTGGGLTAREYISAMRNLHKGFKNESKEGIAITRFHASLMARIFGKAANSPEDIPESMKAVKDLLAKNRVVFCGALRWTQEKRTSDGTSADLAAYLKCPFINLTNIRGLYTANPSTNKSANFIKKTTWKDFHKRAEKIKFKAGQHFVLDQDASVTIMKKRVPTYIVGSLGDVDKIVSTGKGFRGTLISG